MVIFVWKCFRYAFYNFTGTSEICGGVLRNKSGYITSPDIDADEQYDANLNCQWTLIAKEGYVIRYTLQLVEIVGSENCQKDSLWVSEHANSQRTYLKNKGFLCISHHIHIM